MQADKETWVKEQVRYKNLVETMRNERENDEERMRTMTERMEEDRKEMAEEREGILLPHCTHTLPVTLPSENFKCSCSIPRARKETL